MFAAPPVIKTEVYARVPEALRIHNRMSMRPGPFRDCFLEGPVFDREGNIYCVTESETGNILTAVLEIPGAGLYGDR